MQWFPGRPAPRHISPSPTSRSNERQTAEPVPPSPRTPRPHHHLRPRHPSPTPPPSSRLAPRSGGCRGQRDERGRSHGSGSCCSMEEQKTTVSILDDIGSMFDDLADQLDAMLE
ncbi:hypothetical protein F7725_004026 [Dissostichus mawsoni]|uniref:Caskin C-terminal domain-containing protein n=1 Tax=Dissostichus mawsoni TaxID=36200 RepID=A0A7J5YF72_DISMA|nr:hypothetical protein F7725_004026 [Dissostichus mawsoni]